MPETRVHGFALHYVLLAPLPMPSKTEKTPEHMLAAIIEAQVKGGWAENDYFAPSGVKTYLDLSDRYLWSGGERAAYILEILLSPQGLRAAYGSVEMRIESGDKRKDLILNAVVATLREQGKVPAYWEHVAILILLAWLSKPEGDPLAAIQTAYDLLPTVKP